MNAAYTDFLASKKKTAHHAGPTIPADAIHPTLHDWQAYIVQWAARVGRVVVLGAGCEVSEGS